MAESVNVCRCCRGSLHELDNNPLCKVCSPWNDAKELLLLSTPPWQNYMQQHQTELLNQTIDWLRKDRQIISYMPYNRGWAELLRKLTGNSHILSVDIQIENHRDYESYLAVFEKLAARGSLLFPNIAGGETDNNEITVRFNGHEIRTLGQAIIVDGAKIDRGPGTLLFMMMIENRVESPALRFLNLFHQFEGTDHSHATNDEQLSRDVLRDGRFNPYGAADSPRTKSRKKKNAPPPLCDWNHETYLLGIELGTKGRHVIQLPTQPSLLERFLTIWGGRPSTLVSDRLRAATRHLTKIVGIHSEDARITPLERSFSLYRSIIDGNPNVEVIDYGLVVKGGLGILWRITPGRGAHNAPYLIQTMSQNRIGLGQPICMFDDAELPLGDRLSSVVLGLLNDDKLIHQFDQIKYAVHQYKIVNERGYDATPHCDLFP